MSSKSTRGTRHPKIVSGSTSACSSSTFLYPLDQAGTCFLLRSIRPSVSSSLPSYSDSSYSSPGFFGDNSGNRSRNSNQASVAGDGLIGGITRARSGVFATGELTNASSWCALVSEGTVGASGVFATTSREADGPDTQLSGSMISTDTPGSTKHADRRCAFFFEPLLAPLGPALVAAPPAFAAAPGATTPAS